MKRFLIGLLALTFLLGSWASLAHAQASTYWFAQVVDEQGQAVTTGLTCHVFTAGTTTTATVYTLSDLATSKTNPIAGDALGQCTWFSASSVTAFDVIVYHKRGRTRVDAMSTSTHRIVLDLQPVLKTVRIAYTTATSGEINTGVTIPKGAMVVDVAIEVVTASTDNSLDIGLLSSEAGGDADGFCVKKAIGTAGFFRCEATTTGGAANTRYNQNHRGVLLSVFQTGGATTHPGIYFEKPHYGDGTAKTITYTRSTTQATGAGYIHVFYYELSND